METPILSVVIPTYKRPQYLLRAINSALQASSDGSVEVIVVPNGPDESWKRIAQAYATEWRVRWHPIEARHANVARNRGKQLASGKYIRFLDDDDYFLPAHAVEQLLALEAMKGDICTGGIDAVTEDGQLIKHMPMPNTDGDLFSMVARHTRLCLPTAHVFLRERILELWWDETVRVEQDTDWMLRLSARRAWQWITLDTVVGHWTQHRNHRTSGTISHDERARLVSSFLFNSLRDLERRGTLNDSRRESIADGLWGCVHSGLYFSPLHWSRIARQAQHIAPTIRPPDALFTLPGIRHIDPLLIEWLMIPKRWGNFLLRRAAHGHRKGI